MSWRTCRSGCDPAPVLQAPEHDLDPVASLVAVLMVTDGLATRLSARDAGAYPFVFQRFAEPVRIITPVRDQPVGGRQATQEGRCTGVVADLTRCHEEPQGAALCIRHGVEFGVQPALCSPDEAAALVIRPPFFARRLEAVRCAFR